ncbi:hypothetical protein C0995_003278 [Termitomyces sp. Mi166|nr:hypothetical protein C0995_003278 [Termitomyces sp. Mi166\
MLHRQSYTYKATSGSGHRTSDDSADLSTVRVVSGTPSERTPLIKTTDVHTRKRAEKSTEWIRPSNRPSDSAQGPATTVLGSNAATSSSSSRSDESYSDLSTSDVSLSLVNSGSVARDHLASERTFLAYVRTSLAIASAGVERVLALAQILSITEFHSDATQARHVSKCKRCVEAWARPLGATAVVIAMLVLFLGVVRYFTIQKALVGGQFPASRIGIGFVSILFGVLIIATFGVLSRNRLLTL